MIKRTIYHFEIDFVVDPTPLTIEERKKISDIISHYKKTGRKKKISKLTKQNYGKSKQAVLRIKYTDYEYFRD